MSLTAKGLLTVGVFLLYLLPHLNKVKREKIFTIVQ